TITSAASFSLPENTTVVGTVTGSDPDAGSTLAFSIAGGTDADLFDIEAVTGALTFQISPDFELPADGDGDNVYEVQVEVSDGTFMDTQDVAVTVTSVNEAPPAITSTAGYSVPENT